MRTWRNKVGEVIGKLANRAWREANTNPRGGTYKKHRPYRLPAEAEALVECLGDHDQRRGEIEAKAIMEHLRIRGMEID